MAAQLVVKAGGTNEVVDFINEYAEAGIQTFIVRFAAKDQFQHLDVCTEHIMPHFR